MNVIKPLGSKYVQLEYGHTAFRLMVTDLIKQEDPHVGLMFLNRGSHNSSMHVY